MTTMGSGRFRGWVVLAAVLLCLLSQAAWAATYYVATPANGGNDTTGNGSRSAPWATINKADTLKDPLDNTQPLLKPGDTVIVTAGTYTATAAISFKYSSGTADAPITYIAQGDVIIDAGTINAAALQVTAVSASVKGADYLVFDGFKVRGGKRSMEVLGGSYTACREGIVIRNCVFQDVRGTGGAYGAYMLTVNHGINCQVYKNIFFINANPDAGVGATRAISFGNTGYLNKIYNNTVYISGPAGTSSAFYGGYFCNNYSTYANSGYMNPDYMMLDEWGNVTDIVKPEYADQFKNNIIWVKNNESYGAWDYTNQGPTPHRSLNLQHSNNMFWWSSPATQLRFIADYLASGSCSSPGVPDLHEHIFKPTESAQDPMFVSAAPMTAADFALAEGSPAIDAGTDVGLPYYGAAPDLGAIETMPAAYAATGIANALAQADGSIVKLTGSVVTVATGVLQNGMIYIEDESRASGVAVKTTALLTPVAEGQRVEVSGKLDKSGAQPVINAFDLKLASGPGGAIADDTPLKPLGTIGKSVFGDAGLDNTGLLVTIWGKVTYKAADNSYFCVDDGSGKTDGNGNAGVPVYVADLMTPISSLPDPAGEPYVAVTGVVGKKDLGGGVVAVVRPRAAADIR